MPQVEALISANSRDLCAGLASIPGVRLLRPYDAERVSGIVSFKPPQNDPAGVYRALKSKGLTSSLRGGGIRLSPHFYQAGKPLREMLDLIELTIKTI